MKPYRFYLDGKFIRKTKANLDLLEKEWRETMPGNPDNPMNSAVSVDRTEKGMIVKNDLGNTMEWKEIA